jgi:aromatic ring-opening dioxygenase LigB subunit
MLVCAGLSPHPPIIIPEVGGPELAAAESTVTAMKAWAGDIARTGPETLVFISPHAPFLQGALGCLEGAELTGSFAAFGVPEVAFRVSLDQDLAASITEEAAREGVPVVGLNVLSLDHGVMVPFYYLTKAGVSARLVVFGISLLPPERHFRFGQALARAIGQSPRRICLIASGDLSHRLLPEAPAGYDPQGRVFDRLILDSLTAMDAERIMGIPEILADRAGECGLRPIIMLLGALSDPEVWGQLPSKERGHAPAGERGPAYSSVESRIYSYEGPFGVGYMVAGFSLKQPREPRAASAAARTTESEGEGDA